MSDDSSPRPTAPTGPAGRPAKQGSSISVGQILGGILFVLIVIFIAENTRSVKVRIIAGPEVKAPLFVVLLIAAVVGALIAALLRYRRHRKS